MGADKWGHRSGLLLCHFYGRAIRIMRAGREARLALQLNTQAERTRDALMEYLSLTLFIASSGAESEISTAAERWDAPDVSRHC